MSDPKGKKRKKYYHQGGGKRWKQNRALACGMKGFLFTCNKQEKQAIREAYNLLNEYADKLYGPEKIQQGSAAVDNDSDVDEEDIEKALQKEVAAIKEVKPSERRFQALDSGANNCVFIKTTVEDPFTLAHAIFSDLYETQKSRSRFIMRFLPVAGTCKAQEDKIGKLAQELLQPYFEDGEGSSYSVLFKARNSDIIGRSTVLPLLAKVLKELNPNNCVDLDSPDYIISVDVIRTVCCLSIVKDYYKFKKYNLQEVVNTEAAQKDGQDTASEQVNASQSSEKDGNSCEKDNQSHEKDKPDCSQSCEKDKQEKISEDPGETPEDQLYNFIFIRKDQQEET